MNSAGSKDWAGKNDGRDAQSGEAASESASEISRNGIDRRDSDRRDPDPDPDRRDASDPVLDDLSEADGTTQRRRQIARLRPTREAARIARLRASMPVATSEDGTDPLLSQLRKATLPAYFTEEERKHLSEKTRLEREAFEHERAERERLERLRAEEAKAEQERLEREMARKAREENQKLQREEAEQARIIRARRAMAEANQVDSTGVDPLLPVLREGPLPPAPVVDPKQIAKLEKAEMARAKRVQARRAKAELERAKQEQAERDRLERELEKLAKARQEEAEQVQAELDRIEALRSKSEKAQREKAQAERAELEKEEAARALAEKVEIERIEQDRARREQQEREAAELEREASAQAELERTASQRAAHEKLELAQAQLAQVQTQAIEATRSQAVTVELYAADAEAREQSPQGENLERAGSVDLNASEDALPGDLAAASTPAPRRLQAVGVALLVLILVVAALYFSRARLFRATPLGLDDRLMVTAIENRTGDPQLDGALAEAMSFELRESPNLSLLGSDAYRIAARQLLGGAEHPATPVLARQAAEAVGAKAYLYGWLRPSGTGYILSVDVLNVEDNRKLVEVEEAATDRSQIAGAVERVAAQLRLQLVRDRGTQASAGGNAGWLSDVPLNHEATANLDALHLYSVAEADQQDGRTDDALAALQSAATLDPKFIQAQMRLSWIYREQHAAKQSAQAAQLAEQAAGEAGERTRLLAQSTYEANATGNLDQAEAAIRRFAALYPHDPQAAAELARVLRLEGRAE